MRADVPLHLKHIGLYGNECLAMHRLLNIKKRRAELAAGSRASSVSIARRQLGSDTRFPVSVPFYRVYNKLALRTLPLFLSLRIRSSIFIQYNTIRDDLPRRASDRARIVALSAHSLVLGIIVRRDQCTLIRTLHHACHTFGEIICHAIFSFFN